MDGQPNYTLLSEDANVFTQKEYVNSIGWEIILNNARISRFNGIGGDAGIAAQLVSDPGHLDLVITQEGALPLGRWVMARFIRPSGVSTCFKGSATRGTSGKVVREPLLQGLGECGPPLDIPDIITVCDFNAGGKSQVLAPPVMCVSCMV